jgi:hypothetical protein
MEDEVTASKRDFYPFFTCDRLWVYRLKPTTEKLLGLSEAEK